MNTAYDAVVELSGSTCRIAVGARTPLQWYAHAEHRLVDDGGAALLRLGAPPPNAAVLDAVLDHLTTVVRTADVPIATLHVLVHSPDCLVVQAPLQAEADPSACRRALMQQAALLTGARTTSALRLRMTQVAPPLPAPQKHQWSRGAVVPQLARDWTDQWAASIDADEAAIRLSAAHTCDAAAPRLTKWHLGVGCYGPHTEYALWHGTDCAYLYYTPLAQTPADRAYFAALLLNRLQLRSAGMAAAWTYGPDAQDASRMPPIAGVQPRRAQLVQSEAMARLHRAPGTGGPSDTKTGDPLRWAPLHSVLVNAASR